MLKRIQITNMGAFPAFDSGDLPGVVLVDGDNGIGKTSLLDCIKWLGGSGHDPDMIHGGAEFGEVVITLDDGSDREDPTQLRVRTDREGTLRYWRPKGGRRWIKGRDEIDRVYRAIAYDPISFMQLKPKEQVEKYAELSPVDVTAEQLAAAIGEAKAEAAAAKLPERANKIEGINAIRKAIYDARTPLNTGADSQEKHAEELAATLPPAAPDGKDWAAEADRLGAEKIQAEEYERQQILAIEQEFTAYEKANDSAALEQFKAIDADIARRIEELKREGASRKQKVADDSKETVEAERIAANLKAEGIRNANRPQATKLAEDLGVAKERARADQEAKGTRRAIEAATQSAKQKRDHAAKLTAAIERLDNLKKELAAQLAIPGVSFEDGRIVREQNGAMVPLSRWNTADQMTFCLRIGMMLGGGFVCVDHIEAYTEANQQALIETARRYAEQDGVQFILARVNPKGGSLYVGSPQELAVTQ